VIQHFSTWSIFASRKVALSAGGPDEADAGLDHSILDEIKF
jgi:hypothetical protein